MTNTETVPTDDPRVVFAAAARTAGELVASVQPDELAAPTPCEEMDVQALLGHLVMVLDRVAALGNGGDLMAMKDFVVHPADAWASEFNAAAQRAADAWRDDAVLARPMALPWAQGPGAQLLGSYTAELTAHTWDLATALGRVAAFDDRAVATAWAAYQGMLPDGDRQARFDEIRAQMPPEFQSGPPPFANPVEVPDDAPLIDRVVAWTGRRP